MFVLPWQPRRDQDNAIVCVASGLLYRDVQYLVASTSFGRSSPLSLAAIAEQDVESYKTELSRFKPAKFVLRNGNIQVRHIAVFDVKTIPSCRLLSNTLCQLTACRKVKRHHLTYKQLGHF